MLLDGLTPHASYELVVRNGSSSGALPLADGALYAEAEAFPHAFDADADGSAACAFDGLTQKMWLRAQGYRRPKKPTGEAGGSATDIV